MPTLLHFSSQSPGGSDCFTPECMCTLHCLLSVYQLHCGLFTQHILTSSQSHSQAMIGYHYAVTSPSSVSPSPPGQQMVVCIEHELRPLCDLNAYDFISRL